MYKALTLHKLKEVDGMKRKIRLGLALLVSCLLLLVSACSNSSSGQASSSGSKKIQFFVSGDTVEGGALTEMAKEYKKETGVNVQVVDVPYSDFVTRITNMVKSGNPPALARVTGFSPIWKNKLADLTSTLDSKGVDKKLAITLNDKAVALPIDLTAVGLYINKDLFDKAGVKVPTSDKDIWTWDEFISDLKVVLDKTDAKYGLVMDPSSHRLSSFLYQFGSKGFVNENGKYTTNAETKKGLETFVKLNDNKIMPTSVWLSGQDASAMFKSGQVAAYYSGNWQLKDFDKNIKNFKWQSVYMPYEKVRSTNLGGNYVIQFKGSGVEKETKKFIDWLYTKENYAKMAGLGGYLPVVDGANVDYHASETATSAYDVYRNEISSSDPVAAVARSVNDKLQLTSDKQAVDALKQEVIKVLNKEESIDQAISNVEKTFTDQYAK
jgi:alpha-1,4-digalacturonate transport system substrate-binding protein